MLSACVSGTDSVLMRTVRIDWEDGFGYRGASAPDGREVSS